MFFFLEIIIYSVLMAWFGYDCKQKINQYRQQADILNKKDYWLLLKAVFSGMLSSASVVFAVTSFSVTFFYYTIPAQVLGECKAGKRLGDGVEVSFVYNNEPKTQCFRLFLTPLEAVAGNKTLRVRVPYIGKSLFCRLDWD